MPLGLPVDFYINTFDLQSLFNYRFSLLSSFVCCLISEMVFEMTNDSCL